MNVETQLELSRFELRPYQVPIYKALQEGKKRILGVLPRRAGKDLCCWNLLIRKALERIGVYWMVYPTYSMGRKILWNGITNVEKQVNIFWLSLLYVSLYLLL